MAWKTVCVFYADLSRCYTPFCYRPQQRQSHTLHISASKGETIATNVDQLTSRHAGQYLCKKKERKKKKKRKKGQQCKQIQKVIWPLN